MHLNNDCIPVKCPSVGAFVFCLLALLKAYLHETNQSLMLLVTPVLSTITTCLYLHSPPSFLLTLT